MKELQVDSVTKTFGLRTILSDVYLSCKTGEVVGLFGRNGSGKTTLLKIIFGLERANTKFIRVNRKKLNNIYECRKKINYLPQSNFLPNNTKIEQLIKLFLPKRRQELLFKNEHIKPLLDKKNQDLSTGEKRVVEILLLIHSDADFILLDEPFNGVSPIIRESIMECIKENKHNKGFVITDHDYKNVIDISDRLVYLNNGYLKPIQDKYELIKMGYLF